MRQRRVSACAAFVLMLACAAGCGKKEETPSAAPKPAAGPKPAPTVAPAKIPRASICLNGEWDFLPVTDESQKAAPPKDGWRKVRVPSVWALKPSTAGEKTGNYEFDLPEDTAKAQAAWYRLSFPVPKEWNDGRRVSLEFQGINHRSRVYVNGDSTEENEGAHLPVVVNLTQRARFGQANEVCVLVEADPAGSVAGLWRSVYVRCYPSVSLQNVFVNTSVRKKEITVKVWIKNDTEAAHRVVLKNVIRECGSDKVANIFGDLLVGVEPGETKIVEVKRSWSDPKLWGFGIHGEPFLYMLRSELRTADEESPANIVILDALNTRFGFREFWTSGKQFMFNGKPFFIKGDVIGPERMLAHHRAFVTLFYLAQREAGVNFIRLRDPNGFFPKVWYEVADEVGMLVEPEAAMRVTKTKEEVELPGDDQIEVLKNEWEAFVMGAGNHPSIAMYSCDNEICTQDQEMVDGAVFARLNEVRKSIRQNDPTRVIEEQGDVQLGTGQKLGIFTELQVFNAHLAGADPGKALEEIKQRFDYNDRIPIHVGELSTDDKTVGATADLTEASCKAAGEYFAKAMREVRDAGAAGVSLNSGAAVMYFDPKAVAGVARPRWPSLSGEGMKVCQVDTAAGAGGRFNWFDASRPAFGTNVSHELVKKGFKDLDGQESGALAKSRIQEVVAGLAPDGKPLAGAYVFLTRKGQEGRGDTGVMTDSAGTAWFAPVEPGPYEVWAMVAGKRIGKEVNVGVAELTPKAGYGHITWVDLTPGATDKARADVGKPVEGGAGEKAK